MTQEKGIPYRRHKPSAALREFLDPLDPGSYFDCGQARLHGLDDALLKEAESRGRTIGDDSFQLVATDMGLIYCRPSISFAIAARWDEVALIRPHGEDPVILSINWPTHGELKFTVSKRLAGNVFRRWLQLRMQSERLARREKAERFNLKPNQGANAQPGAPESDPGAAVGDDGWEVVTEVGPTHQELADPVMQAMPDRRDRGAAARRRRQDSVGKAKRRLRREGSTVSMPPGVADADHGAPQARSRHSTAGVPKPVRPSPSARRSSVAAPGGAEPGSSRSGSIRPDGPNGPAGQVARSADPAPPRPPGQTNPSLGSRTGAEVTTHLPTPLTPPRPGDDGQTLDPEVDLHLPADGAPAPDETVPSAPPAGVHALRPPDESSATADGSDETGSFDIADLSDIAGLSDGGLHSLDSSDADLSDTDSPHAVPSNPDPAKAVDQLNVAPVDLGGTAKPGVRPADRPIDAAVDSPLAEVTETVMLPPAPSVDDRSERQPEGVEAADRGRELGRGDLDGDGLNFLDDEDEDRFTTEPSWIGGPVSIVVAMVVISTFVLIAATATASYRRSVEVGSATDSAVDPAGAGLVDPAGAVRTTIDHQRFNPAARPSVSVAVEAPTTTAVTTTEVTVLPLEGGPTDESTLQGTPRLCNSNYSGCVPDVSDVDCPGDGDGPLYSTEPAVVMGQDVYELDTDGDGETCEPDQPLHAELSGEAGDQGEAGG